MRVGVFRSNKALNDYQQKALRDWLLLLRMSLPQEWALHDLIDDLLDNFATISKKSSALDNVLARHPLPRVSWSMSCGGIGKVGGGFTCGFWKLLHTATIGVAEYRGGLNLIKSHTLRPDARVLSPEAAADIIREYVANFFPCTECSKHFVKNYDDCSYRRCHRLTSEAEGATDADWMELAKWMWEFHNEVNVRLLHEAATRNKRTDRAYGEKLSGPGVDDEIKALWPTISECVTCFRGDGAWNEGGVFAHLERSYWYVYFDIV